LTLQQKRDCTLVLKGVIALSSTRFPRGTKSPMLDAIARAPIWAGGVDYGHGTGHGVGAEVHENPRVGPKAPEILQPGLAITVEAGIYLDGRFGVRIEDLVLITKAGHENLYRSSKELISV